MTAVFADDALIPKGLPRDMSVHLFQPYIALTGMVATIYPDSFYDHSSLNQNLAVKTVNKVPQFSAYLSWRFNMNIVSTVQLYDFAF